MQEKADPRGLIANLAATAVSLALLAADRALKAYALHSLPKEGVFWIPGLLGLERFENRGLAFGIPAGTIFPILLSLAALAFLAYHLARRKRGRWTALASGLVVLGALSNLYDRMTLGYVVDYLRIGPWSLVNLADGMVVAGLATLVLEDGRETGKTHGTLE